MKMRLKVRLGVKLALAISVFTLLLTPLASQAGRSKDVPVNQPSGSRLSPADFDIRRQQSAPSQAPTPRGQAALQQLQRQIQGLEIRFNPITGTPRHLFSLTQRLTAPSGAGPLTIARDFLTTHQALFRLQDRDLDDLVLAKNYRTQHNGVTHLVLRQLYQGLDVFQGHIKVNVDRNGQILSVSGNYFPDLVASVSPALSAEEAVRIAARHLDPDLAFTPARKAPATGVEQATLFDRGPFREDITAKLVIFPAHDKARLAWKTRLHLPARLAWCDIVVDAQTGELLYRHNLYQFDQPQGFVFERNPDAGPQVMKSFVGDASASPETWVTPPPNIRTLGNNVLALPAAQNAEQNFRFPFTNAYGGGGPNVFDLDMQTLRFTPNAAGGYDAQLVPLKFDTNFGGNLTSTLIGAGGRRDADDGFFQLDLGFDFPFFGTNFNIMSVNANGFVTFGLHVVSFVETWEDLILGPPRIAALWDDLNPSRVTTGGGVFAKVAADSATITWHRVPQFGVRDVNTVQLTILRTGVIEISFNGVEVTDGLVGVTRGAGEFNLQSVNFLANAPITGRSQGLAQKFPTVELESAVTNVFYHLNFLHDYLYALGFDEEAGNFQTSNFNRGGVGNDPVLAFAQDAEFNNAFFATPEDGFSPIASFNLFTEPPLRQVDSAFDADVLYHEYVHGLTNRLVGTFNVGALSGFQSAALGEGWSDSFAVSITNDPIIGEYTAGDQEKGIRTVNYSQSPLVFGDFGNRLGPLSALGLSAGIALDMTFIPEEHQDGEIWASTLWDVRLRLGQETFEQLITDALKVTPSNPSILDARDAILIADVASYGGAHVDALWTIFAARGMGFSARTGSGEDTIVFQAFDTPSQPLLLKKETIFFDDMSRGVSGWTVTGVSGRGEPPLWHQSTRRGSFAWYYGREAEGNYFSGTFRNYGAITSPVIDLTNVPRDSTITLEFDHFMRGDPTSPILDNGYVRVMDPASGEVLTQLACVVNHTLGGRGGEFFEHEELNISRFAGQPIQVQFYFDTVTGTLNNAEGWYIDNVRVSRRVR